MKRRALILVLALALLLALCGSAFAVTTTAVPTALTRGRFITALYAASGDQDAHASQDAFDDVPAAGELAQAVCWAADKGIVNGCAERKFAPDAPVTREQMAAMLYRNAQAVGQAPEGEWSFPLGFADAGEVSAYADEAMQWAVMNQILIGTEKGLEPKATATEKQLSIVLERWQCFLTQPRGILFLFTNDVHCGVDQGFGYAGLQEMRSALEKQGYAVALVDCGDSIQGDALGTMTRGEEPSDLMNRMGYDVAVPGNHDFDYGMAQFLSLAEKAAFPYVCCNFRHEGQLVFEPYTILELGGKKIAFAGVTTPKTITSSTPKYFQNEAGEFVYDFMQDETGEGVYSALQNAAQAARAEGADYVVALSHLGNKAGTAPWTYGDVISNTSGIDVMLDGHSHDTDMLFVKNADGNPIPRVSCGTKLACVGWCRITADGALSTGHYVWNRESSAPELLGIENEMSRAVAAATAALDARLDEVAATAMTTLTINDPVAQDSSGRPIRMVRRAETNIGDFCADAYRAQSGADVAFVNGGGIRANIDAGGVTLRNIFSVHPYGNEMCMIEVTGQQILDALEWGARSVPDENGGFLQVSGLSYEIHSYIASGCVADVNGMFVRVEGERRVKNVLIGGEPLDPEKIYTLASHNYMLLDHGDGYTMFDGATLLLDRVKLDNQVLIDYAVETLGGVIGEAYADPCGEGRITIVGSAP